jgi:large subunit ribosomal protein L21
MKYAVIRTGGKQYKVTEGQILEVEHLEATPDSAVTFSDVLLVAGEESPVIGSPLIAGVTVTGKVLGDVKGEKIRVSKYKAKVRYRRVTGHRQLLTRVQIDKIGSSKEKAKSTKEKEQVATA